jgi:hypothetical protein
MKRLTLSVCVVAVALAAVVPLESMAAQRRRRIAVRRPVVVRRPIVRTRMVVRNGYPIRRALPTAVVVRPARRVVTLGAPLIFLPSLAWTPTVAALPAGETMVWQDSETIERDEGWVDNNFGVDSHGSALFLQIDGTTELNFAEITFADGNVQVVDFSERTLGSGIYKLLGFADRRHVKTARLLARSESNETKLAVYLRK